MNENVKSMDDEQNNDFTPHSHHNFFADLKTPDSVSYPKEKIWQIKSDDCDLEALYEYFDKNGEKFQQEIELKNIVVENENILIKKKSINEYTKSIVNSHSIEEKNQEEVIYQISQMTNSTLVETLQSLIDEGELLHAFQIYLTIKERINIPEKQVRLWSHSFIELLRTNRLHKSATECVKTSNINEIRNTNKVP